MVGPEGEELPAAVTVGPAGQRVDAGKGRIFPCPSCGADLEFHIGQQTLACPFCGHQAPLTLDTATGVTEQDFESMLKRLAEQRKEKKEGERAGEGAGAGEREARPETQPEIQEVRCDSCGANVEFTGALTSTRCPFCGSPIQRENVHRSKDRIPVDGVLPFQIDRVRAQGNLRRWVKGLWFAPNDFKKQGVEGKLTGVYLPYWTYDAMTFCRYKGERGDNYTVTIGTGKNRRTVTRTRWSPKEGFFQRFFDDVLIPGNDKLPPASLLRLEPWPLEKTLPFTEEALAGYFAETYEVAVDEAFPKAKERMDEALRTEVRKRIGGDRQRIHRLASKYSAITYKHVLLPVWLMSYRYKDKPYQVVINAGSGEVFGERPWSVVKITLLIIFILLVVSPFFLN